MNTRPRKGDDEALGESSGEDIVHRLISDEVGEPVAEVLRKTRREQEILYHRAHPDEGLRERKRRLISDAATAQRGSNCTTAWQRSSATRSPRRLRSTRATPSRRSPREPSWD
jgi:chromatin segregation and condensation protein Rec8/ScpA/Scc1 (kleisin family)